MKICCPTISFVKTGTAKAINFHPQSPHSCQSQWPSGLRHVSAAVGLLGLRVRILPGAWMSLSCECCVLSSRGLCVGVITPPEETYRVWYVWMWSWNLSNEEALAHWGLSSPFLLSLTNLSKIRYCTKDLQVTLLTTCGYRDYWRREGLGDFLMGVN